MLPAVVSNVVFIPPQQAPLVNTAVLGSNVTRVPSDNVPPSVSNEPIQNNSRGSGGGFTLPMPAAPAGDDESAAFSLPSGRSPSPSIILPTSFLAQLLGQNSGEGDSITRGILIGYERLVALSNVKYKPSNALKPLPGPAGVFGAILQQQAGTPQAAQESAPVITGDSPPVATTTVSAAATPDIPTTAPAETSRDETPVAATPTEGEASSAQISAQISVQVPRAQNGPIILPDISANTSAGISAYIASGLRNDAIGTSRAPADEAVSDFA